jgi:hypothetical protein
VAIAVRLAAHIQQLSFFAVPVDSPAVPVVSGGVCPGGQGLGEDGCAEAGTDVTVLADGVGELVEPAVLFGDLEVR